jgi:hypothetical protein
MAKWPNHWAGPGGSVPRWEAAVHVGLVLCFDTARFVLC